MKRKNKTESSNFLIRFKGSAKAKKNRKKRNIILIFCLIGLTVSLALFSYSGFKYIYKPAVEGKNKLLKAQEYVKAQDFSEARVDLSGSLEKFKQSKTFLSYLGFLRIVPIISSQYQALNTILESGIEVVESLDKILALAINILEPVKKDSQINLALISTEEKNEILGKIYHSQSLLLEVKQKMNHAHAEIKAISEKGLIGPLKETVILLKKELPAIDQGIDLASSLAQILPSVAGYPELKSYLFLLENNTELRATGGFIGTYGILKVKDGEIESFFTDNIYNLDEKASDLNIEPPMPFARYNRVERWYMRDSNWSPDFPTAAEKALWFYEQEGGTEKNLDGVLAITPTLIESLVGLTGSITVHGIEFTKDNFVDALQYQVERGFYQQGIELSQRKEIIGDLSTILIDKVLSLPQEKWDDLFGILEKNLEEKHLLIYLKDTHSQNLVSEKNWGGEIRASAGDYFALIDTNLASLKTDPGVKRTINYYLEEVNGKLIANLQVIYRNEGAFTWKTTRYRTYFRLYVPEGSKLNDIIGTNEPKEVVDELGRTYFGSFIVIEPEETKKIMFTYELPDRFKELIEDNKYQLLVQKQAGTANYDLNVVLEFKSKIKDFEPIDFGQKEEDNKLIFKTSLNQDLLFSVNIK